MLLSKICVAKVWVIMNYVCAKLCKSDFSVTMISHDENFLDSILNMCISIAGAPFWFRGDFSDLSYSSQGLLFSRGFLNVYSYPDRFGHHRLPKQVFPHHESR